MTRKSKNVTLSILGVIAALGATACCCTYYWEPGHVGPGGVRHGGRFRTPMFFGGGGGHGTASSHSPSGGSSSSTSHGGFGSTGGHSGSIGA